MCPMCLCVKKLKKPISTLRWNRLFCCAYALGGLEKRTNVPDENL
jgi:hypothetical protein